MERSDSFISFDNLKFLYPELLCLRYTMKVIFYF